MRSVPNHANLWMGLLLGLVALVVGSPQTVQAVRHSTPRSLQAEAHAPHASHHAMMSNSSFFTLLGAGFLTGVSHCLGMCGPLVGAFAVRRRAARQELAAPLVLFQMGRLGMYGLLGTVAGGFGAAFAVVVHDWQGVFAMLMGVLAVVMGLSLLNVFPLHKYFAALLPIRLLSTWITARLASAHPAAPFALGLANGLLPCGPVYAVASLAAISADPFKGGSLMLLFGLGTLPFMLAAGFSMALFPVRLRQGLYRLAAVLVVVVGVQLTLRGLALYGYIPHTALGSVMLW